MSLHHGTGLEPWSPDVALAPAPGVAPEPEGYVVLADDGTRLHFLDWGGPAGHAGDGVDAGRVGDDAIATGAGAPVLLLPGLLQPAWSWTPVARRLAFLRRVVVADLRGQGLSDSPMTGYDIASLAADAMAVAQGSGILRDGRIVVAGHGFGGVVAASAASSLGDRCAGLVLVDGGWERLETTTGVDVEEFLRGLDEPPEVLRSMDAFLADRRAFDPASWDEDQERAARDAVVETAAGHVVRAVRPHVVEAMVRTMFAWEPAGVIEALAVPVGALVALGTGDVAARLGELRRTAEARADAGGTPIRACGFASAGHNLMRYRPADVTAALAETG